MQEIIQTNSSRHHNNPLQVLKSYYQLTKPRIILLLLITTAAGMWLAAEGEVDPLLLLVTMVGGTLASGAANTINCLYDSDIDYIMERTRWRPIPSGRVKPRDAMIFAIALAIASFTLLTVFANLLAALLAMSGIVFYVAIYTHWLKRHSTQNIVIGGAAGAIPPLVGWAAVTGDLSWAAWLLFVIIFLWTPPHFWALAIMIRDEYQDVGVPMLPVIEGDELTAQQIWIYSLVLIPTSLLLVYPLHTSGWVYGAIALGLGAVFLQKAWELLQTPHNRDVARSLFKYSILYLMLLCAGMVVDSLPATHEMTMAVAHTWQTWMGVNS
ncbi:MULTISPECIES: heme o synthase [Oscillatoriales]|jgi:protoheme IX farnesyltransferase|uniref:Protoheme IX farnesyltransferase n=3 Tax=Limnospira TaxID=2596745 RepID=A0A9P1KGR2_9CYAN|nr:MULTISPECIES: heme o synthase [Oscillatoriales]EKD07195.1 protoheme IX farnesyltransferase [Arthrospira platensis C1]MBD2710609.1 protoheme IX farnesyltransferase [Arthrospira platensis FACHB-835]MDC0839470.1 heme o synthase [Limnoraphis robusta]MDT9183595.1 heme o synthase [Limnospira sp. PMC 289.06]MDY7053803.1 heme o synthase [Limnospira fusiformis LS22]QJB25993.1 protoheme IX farnesyltransferase [Limnospira fusiformis SAG 85.79]RAQ46798.1 protoheme IX farnesyltransferase [Arthrospira 